MTKLKLIVNEGKMKACCLPQEKLDFGLHVRAMLLDRRDEPIRAWSCRRKECDSYVKRSVTRPNESEHAGL
jgi:hypothetical protein